MQNLVIVCIYVLQICEQSSLFLQMKSSRTCLSASQPMEMPASRSQWRSMAQFTQVCMCVCVEVLGSKALMNILISLLRAGL